MDLSTPIFGEGGRIEGDLTSEHAQAPVSIGSLGDAAFLAPTQPTTSVFRDRAAEQEAALRDFHTTLMRLNPALARALALLRNRQEAVRRWEAIVVQKEGEASRMRNLVKRAALSLSYEDAEGTGTREQRLAAAASELREATEELLAAREELIFAQQKVDELTTEPA